MDYEEQPLTVEISFADGSTQAVLFHPEVTEEYIWNYINETYANETNPPAYWGYIG